MVEFKLPQKYVPSIQVLRAIAAWSVVLCHYNQVFFDWDMSGSFLGLKFAYLSKNYGPLGVDIFFVISGFIIFLSGEKAKSAKQFFLNRATRIIPPYWFFTFVLLALVTFFPEANKTEIYWTGESILKSLFFVPHENPSPDLGRFPFLTVGWTLNYEVMFYLSCSVLLVIFRKWWFIPMLALLMFGKTLWIVDVFAYFFHSYYIREFGWGMLIALAYRKGLIPDNNFIGLAVLALSVYLFYLGGAREYTVPAVGFFVLAGLCFKDNLFANPFSQFLQHLGNVSYSTYLAHGAVSFSVCLSIYGKHSVYPNEFLLLSTYILLTYACSYFGNRYIEDNSFNRWVRNL